MRSRDGDSARLLCSQIRPAASTTSFELSSKCGLCAAEGHGMATLLLLPSDGPASSGTTCAPTERTALAAPRWRCEALVTLGCTVCSTSADHTPSAESGRLCCVAKERGGDGSVIRGEGWSTAVRWVALALPGEPCQSHHKSTQG